MPSSLYSRGYKPTIEPVPLEQARAWRGGGKFLFEEKIDGEFSTLPVAHHLLAGETAGGKFHAFDLVIHDHQDIRPLPLRERLRLLDQVLSPANISGIFPELAIVRPARGTGGEFLEHILARGGEGIVAKPLDAPYAVGWLKAKHLENFAVSVTRLLPASQSVAFEEIDASVLRRRQLAQLGGKITVAHGHVALRGGKIDQVRPGTILKIVGYGQNPSGRIREPRIDTDTPSSWLIHY
jgi:hypothetical protein